MNKYLLALLIICIIITDSIAQNVTITNEEASLLNEHFELNKEEYNFTGKQVYFFHSTTPSSKEEFFNDLIKWKEENSKISAQYIVLNKNQKVESGGYDVFVYAWSKFQISTKQIGSHIEKIKKRSTTKVELH